MNNTVYHVKTYGDCEGRTVKSLGFWKGNLADIVVQLHRKAVYELMFEEVLPKTPISTLVLSKKDFSVSFKDHIPTVSEKMDLKDLGLYSEGSSDCNFTFKKEPEDIRKTALSKLTPEERKSLGF